MRTRSIVALTLLLSSVVLLIAGSIAYRATLVLAQATGSLVHTKDVSLALERTLSNMRDAETGQRGYLLTRRTSYLEPYNQALTQIDRQVAELRTLLAADPDGLRLLDELATLVRIKVDELARTIELERGGASQEALAVVLTDTGRFTMDEIRASVARIQENEDRKLTIQLADERAARRAVTRSIVITTALAIAILTVLVLVVRRDAARIRASEQRLATTLRSIGDAVIATDARGIVTLMNPVAEELTAWRSHEAVGKHMDEVFRIIGEDTRTSVESPVTNVLREGRIVGLANHTLLLRRDGTELPIEDSAAPINDPDGETLGVVLVFRDATAARTAEQSLHDADRRKDEFLAVLAHELRNPLAPIRQAAQVARSPGATPAQAEWGHSVIERQVEHMARLLDDLLDVSRITRGTLSVRKSGVELASIVTSAIEMARPLIDSRGHELKVELPDEPLPLEADPLRLAQVIGNLLTNAAKYTRANGRIRLSAERSGDTVVVRIADNGIGLSRESLASIFQMFVQIESPLERTEGGLGIGLALSKGLVELHDGSIEAHSAGVGRGSEFVVRLPLAPERRAATGGAAHAATERNGRGLRLLVADDNRDAAASLAALLTLGGHEVNVVHDGTAAFAALEQAPPDIALLDIGMPSMNGYDLAKQVRTRDWGKAITLVAVTGWGQHADKQRALEAGFDHHWVKPIEVATALALCEATARSKR